MSTTSSRRERWATFIDRDGVLVDAVLRAGVVGSPRSVSEMRVLPGATDAVRLLQSVGSVALVITNQPDVGRGDLTESALAEMHDVLRDVLGVDDVMTCAHSGRGVCDCRKPAPGMLLTLAQRYGIDLGASWTIGDRWVDIAAGRAAGTRTVLIDRPYSWAPTSSGAPAQDLEPDHRAADILTAAELIADSRAPAVPPHGDPAQYSRPIPAQELQP